MHSLFVASLGLLTGCGLVPTVGAPVHGADSAGSIVPIDIDGDGSPEGEDCNDDDGAMAPGSPETCDGKDNDCNGTVDDTADAILYYRDADVDGWGSETDSMLSCTVPDGYLTTAGDCDDADPAVHPEADDWCDGVDSDCDGTTDEDDVIWYLDSDVDGYGGDAGVVSCKPLEGHVLVDGDCDDADPEIHPGVLDDDCDELDDDCDDQLDEDSVLEDWHYDLDGDGFGAESFSIQSCSQPYLGMITEGSDCDDEDGAVHPGAKEVCNLVDDNCDDTVDEGFETQEYWTDADGDNWGVGASFEACTDPPDSAQRDGDCDDDDAAINPAEEEICGDGIDQDCDKTDAVC